MLLSWKYRIGILIKDGSDNVDTFGEPVGKPMRTYNQILENLSNIYKNEVSYKYQIAP